MRPGVVFWNFNFNGFHLPNILTIFVDGPVAGEFAGSGDVEDGHLGPFVLIPVYGINLILTVDVGLIIS